MPRDISARIEVRVTDLDEVLRELVRVITISAPQPAPAPAASDTPEDQHPLYVAGWKAGYKHGAWQAQHCAQPAASGEPFGPDWDRIEALQESLREHMAEIHRLRAALAQPAASREPNNDAPDVADIIAGTLQTSRGHAYELMQDALEARGVSASGEPVARPMCAERQQQRQDNAQWHADIAKGRSIVAEAVAAAPQPAPARVPAEPDALRGWVHARGHRITRAIGPDEVAMVYGMGFRDAERHHNIGTPAKEAP
jgi:hypothetical protein